MSLTKNPRTGLYEANIRDRKIKRLHVSLKSSGKAEARRRYAAVEALVREGNEDAIELLRRRKINVEDVTALYESTPRKPFSTLLDRKHWPTLQDAVADYQAWVNQHPKRAPKTREAVEQRMRVALEYFGADRRLDAITTEEIAQYTTHLGTNGRHPRTVGLFLVQLSALFNWIEKRERRRALQARRVPLSLPNPVDRETVPEIGGANRVRFLAREEATRLFAATPDRLRLGVALGILAGLRINEMLMLRPPPHDIDLENGLLLIQARDGWTPKYRKNREVPISSELRPLVEHHLAKYASPHYVFAAVREPTVPMHEQTFVHHFKQIVTTAGLLYGHAGNGVTYHTLRHTFASWLVMAGVDLFTIARLLGHTTTRMVEMVYGHLSPDHKRRAVEQLSRFLPVSVISALSPASGNGAENDGIATTTDTESFANV